MGLKHACLNDALICIIRMQQDYNLPSLEIIA